MLETNSTKL